MISEHDKANVGIILKGYGDWFSAQLLRLVAKSDTENLEKLRTVYPEHVKAYEDYVKD